MPERPWGVSRRRRGLVDDARQTVKSPPVSSGAARLRRRVVMEWHSACSSGRGVVKTAAGYGQVDAALGRSRRVNGPPKRVGMVAIGRVPWISQRNE
jgi:hypothetical protein